MEPPDSKATLSESHPTIPAFIEHWLKRTGRAAGLITIFLGLAGFGAGLLLGSVQTGIVCALITFGIVGALEAYHLQVKVKLLERLKERTDRNALFNDIRKARSSMPKMLREFEHNGFRFRTVGLEDVPLPLTMSAPLCPKCTGTLAQRSWVIFPGIARIKFLCACGFSKSSALTRAELIEEAEQIGNLPT